jgi:hypothetical protein
VKKEKKFVPDWILILHAKYEAYQMHFNPSFDAHQKSRRHTLVSRKESSGNILKWLLPGAQANVEITKDELER